MNVYSSMDQKSLLSSHKKVTVMSKIHIKKMYQNTQAQTICTSGCRNTIALPILHSPERIFVLVFSTANKNRCKVYNHRINTSYIWIPFRVSSYNMWGDQISDCTIHIVIVLSIFCANNSNLRFVEWLGILTIFFLYHPKNVIIVMLFVMEYDFCVIIEENQRRTLVVLWYVIPCIALMSIIWTGRQTLNSIFPINREPHRKISFVALPFRSRVIPIAIFLIVVINWMIQRRNYPTPKEEI